MQLSDLRRAATFLTEYFRLCNTIKQLLSTIRQFKFRDAMKWMHHNFLLRWHWHLSHPLPNLRQIVVMLHCSIINVVCALISLLVRNEPRNRALFTDKKYSLFCMWNRYVYLINTGQAICIDILFVATILLVYAEHIQSYLQSGRNSFCTQIDFFIFLIEICSFSSFQWFPLHGNYCTVLAPHLQPHHTCSGKVQHWLRHIYNYLSPYQHLYHTGTSAWFCIVLLHTWVSEWRL